MIMPSHVISECEFIVALYSDEDICKAPATAIHDYLFLVTADDEDEWQSDRIANLKFQTKGTT